MQVLDKRLEGENATPFSSSSVDSKMVLLPVVLEMLLLLLPITTSTAAANATKVHVKFDPFHPGYKR